MAAVGEAKENAQVRQQKVKQTKNLFDMLDVNADGFVDMVDLEAVLGTHPELAALLAAADDQVSGQEQGPEQGRELKAHLKAFINQSDRDGDGKLSFYEFAIALGVKPLHTKRLSKAFFAGALSSDASAENLARRISTVRAYEDEPLMPEEDALLEDVTVDLEDQAGPGAAGAFDIFSSLDLDGDGYLSLQDMISFVKANPGVLPDEVTGGDSGSAEQLHSSLQSFITASDLDQDGKLSFVEFSTAIGLGVQGQINNEELQERETARRRITKQLVRASSNLMVKAATRKRLQSQGSASDAPPIESSGLQWLSDDDASSSSSEEDEDIDHSAEPTIAKYMAKALSRTVSALVIESDSGVSADHQRKAEEIVARLHTMRRHWASAAVVKEAQPLEVQRSISDAVTLAEQLGRLLDESFSKERKMQAAAEASRAELKQIRRNLDTAHEKLREQHKDMVRVQMDASDAQGQIESQQEKVSKMRHQLSQQQKEMVTKEQELAVLQSELNLLRKEVAARKDSDLSDTDALRAGRNSPSSGVSEQRHRVAALEEELAEMREQSANLQQRLDARHAALQQAEKDAAAQLEEAKAARLETVQAVALAREEEQTRAVQRVQAVQTELSARTAEIAQLQATHAEAAELIEQLQVQARERETELRRLKMAQQQNSREPATPADDSNEALVHARQQLEELQNQLTQSEQHLQEQQQDLHRLRQQLAEQSTAVLTPPPVQSPQDLTPLEQLRSENSSQAEIITGLQRQLQATQERVQELELQASERKSSGSGVRDSLLHTSSSVSSDVGAMEPGVPFHAMRIDSDALPDDNAYVRMDVVSSDELEQKKGCCPCTIS